MLHFIPFCPRGSCLNLPRKNNNNTLLTSCHCIALGPKSHSLTIPSSTRSEIIPLTPVIAPPSLHTHDTNVKGEETLTTAAITPGYIALCLFVYTHFHVYLSHFRVCVFMHVMSLLTYMHTFLPRTVHDWPGYKAVQHRLKAAHNLPSPTTPQG